MLYIYFLCLIDFGLAFFADFINLVMFVHRYEDKLPRVDIFVCTADPEREPPSLVINTVLSVMSYNYPPEKLSVYLSDDGGSEFTFYALLEASEFAKQWIPFCKEFDVEPRSPEAYFARMRRFGDQHAASGPERTAIEASPLSTPLSIIIIIIFPLNFIIFPFCPPPIHRGCTGK